MRPQERIEIGRRLARACGDDRELSDEAVELLNAALNALQWSAETEAVAIPALRAIRAAFALGRSAR